MVFSDQDQPVINRVCARVPLLDNAGRISLLTADRPYRLPFPVWLTPGGGVDRGEPYEQAAIRELREKTGIERVELGPCVWEGRFSFTNGARFCNHGALLRRQVQQAGGRS